MADLTKKFRQDLFRMRLQKFVGFVVGLFTVPSLAGCEKKSGEAMVLEKEHIVAMETPPKNEQAASPNKSATNDDARVTELGKNDITVEVGWPSKRIFQKFQTD